jgi:hypothetical protein
MSPPKQPVMRRAGPVNIAFTVTVDNSAAKITACVPRDNITGLLDWTGQIVIWLTDCEGNTSPAQQEAALQFLSSFAIADVTVE